MTWDWMRTGGGLRSLLPRRLVKFALVGLSGVVVDMVVLFLLSDPHALGWGLTPGKVVASELAIANNFLWNDAWTFGDVAARQGYGLARLKRFGKFNAICAGGLLMSVLLLNLQVRGLGLNRYLANAVAIGLVTFWNFWMNKTFSWAPGARGAHGGADPERSPRQQAR